MREDFRTVEVPAASLRKPGPVVNQPKSQQQQLSFRNAPAGRRNLYGAPRMDQRPLPSLPNIVETCSMDSNSSGAFNAAGGVRRTVQADINTGERSASLRDRASGVAVEHPSKVKPAPTTVTGISATMIVGGTVGTSETSNISTQQSGPLSTGACMAFGSLYPPPQHYTVLDPIEARLMTRSPSHQLGCGGVHLGPCPIATVTPTVCGGLQGENSACAQSYRSHSDDGSTSGSSEEAHLLNSSCHEIPLRPMREGTQPTIEQNNSGNCSWP